MLNEHDESSIYEIIRGKIDIQNVATNHQFSKMFKLSSLYKYTSNYIERCFAMVVDTHNFLELEYTLIAKIMTSSELHITSEVEVYNAVDRWLKYSIAERSKFAQSLLLKVRLHLLSGSTLKHLLSKSSSFTAIDECTAIIKTKIINTERFKEKSRTYYTNRSCNQKDFNVLFCGGLNYFHEELVQHVIQISGHNFNDVKVLPSMIEKRGFSTAVCIKGEVYVFGGYVDSHKPILSVEKYSCSTNTWNNVGSMLDNRELFSVCAFMDKIYVIGGSFFDKNRLITSVTDACLVFDATYYKWKEIVGMSQARRDAASAVFEEKIVVSGGWDNNRNKLNTVQSYDVIGEEWSPMPSMIGSKSLHSLVVVKNKLFVIGCGIDTCEVFDNSCRKFVDIKRPQEDSLDLDQVISIGSNIFVMQCDSSSLFCYDVDNDKWSEKPFEVTKHFGNSSCVKLPWY